MIVKSEENNSIPVKIEYAFVEDFSAFVIQKNKAVGSLNLGKDWQQFDSTLFSFRIKEITKNSAYGSITKSTIEFSLTGDNLELNSDIISLLNAKLIFRITYNGGLQKTLGTLKKPCYISFDNINELLPNNKFTTTSNQPLFYYHKTESFGLLIGDDETLLIGDETVLIL